MTWRLAVRFLVLLSVSVLWSNLCTGDEKTPSRPPVTHEDAARAVGERIHFGDLATKFWRGAMASAEGNETKQKMLRACDPQRIVDETIVVVMRHYSRKELQDLLILLDTEEGKSIGKVMESYAKDGVSFEESAANLDDDELESLVQLMERPPFASFIEQLPALTKELHYAGHRLGEECWERVLADD